MCFVFLLYYNFYIFLIYEYEQFIILHAYVTISSSVSVALRDARLSPEETSDLNQHLRRSMKSRS